MQARAVCSPARLEGIVPAPPSKSVAHRAILCAALAALNKEPSRLAPIDLSKDISATLGAVSALGVSSAVNQWVCTIAPEVGFVRQSRTIDCCESGSTLRFLIPISPHWGRGPLYRTGPPAGKARRRLYGSAPSPRGCLPHPGRAPAFHQRQAGSR